MAAVQVPYTAGRLFGSHPEEDGGLSAPNKSMASDTLKSQTPGPKP